MKEKICYVCTLTLPITSFAWKNKAKGTYTAECRACHSVYQKAHYQANKQAYLTSVKLAKAARKQTNEVFYSKLKDLPCTDCGIKYPSYVMDFDHLPGHIKEYNVARLMHNQACADVLAKEIAKCEIVCANCHRERTHQRKHTPLV